MEKQEILQRLLQMKKELHRKQYKLEKSKRAAKVRAHVKKKIQEQNLLYENNGQCEDIDERVHEQKNGSMLKPPERKKLFINGETCLLSPNGRNRSNELIKIVEADNYLAKTGDNSKLLRCVHHLSAGSRADATELIQKTSDDLRVYKRLCTVDTIDGNSQNVSEQIIQDQSVISETHTKMPLSGLMCSGQSEQYKPCENVDNSLAVTPMFQNTEDTDIAQSILANNNVALDTNQESLSLDLCSKVVRESQDTSVDHSDSFLSGKQDFSVCSIQTASSVNKFLTLKPKCENKRGTLCCASAIEKLGTCAKSLKKDFGVKQQSTIKIEGAEMIECLSLSPDAFRDSEKDAHLKDNHAMLEPDEQLQSQEEGIFSEYTELDVIPFSQIELAEDFLSEGTASFQGPNHSQKSFRRRNSMVLIKRRSPRLSSTHFRATSLEKRGRSTSSAWSGWNSCVSSQGVEKISFHVCSKRKRTKTALLLSSLFQFFIDEAKRNQSFREFELPRDLVEQVLDGEHAAKDISKEMQKDYPKVTYVGKFDQFVDVISETELDPQIQSEVFGNANVLLGNREIEDAKQSESQTESVKLKSDQESNLCTENDTYSLSNPHYDNTLPARSKLFKVKNISDRHGSRSVPRQNKATSANQIKSSARNQPSHEMSPQHFLKTRLAAQDRTSLVMQKRDRGASQHKQMACHEKRPVGDLEQDITCSAPCELTGFVAALSEQSITTADSPVLFGTQSNSGDSMKDPAQAIVVPEISQGKSPQAAITEAQLLFTPRTMHADENHSFLDGFSWITFAGCAESGCKKQVVALLRGIMENAEGEKSPYLLSVQPTSLTLWSYHDDVTWTAELHWYLPQEHEALNACKISDAGQRLVAAAWGSSLHSLRLFVTVFIFHWNTQQTLRFNLRLPSAACPLRLFCHGLPKADQSTLVVFSIDKAYSRGRKYVLNTDSGSISTQREMEVVGCQLLDMQLVQDLSEAVAGLSSDNRILLWNHVTGVLIISLNLESPLPVFSRMFTCFSHQGFLLLHMQAIDTCELCLVGINPMKSTGKVLKVFHYSDHQERLSSLMVHDNLVLATTGCGKMYVWDAVSATYLAAITNPHGCITCINIISIKNNMCLATGHAAGCIHLYYLA